MKTVRTIGTDPSFQDLVNQLDTYLSGVNGPKDPFFRHHNSSLELTHVVLILEGEKALACGAFKEHSPTTIEIKRMFVSESHRNSGLAHSVLKALLQWGQELGYQKSILETAKSMTPAVTFYSKFGYSVIDNYGPYVGVDSSVCFEMSL